MTLTSFYRLITVGSGLSFGLLSASAGAPEAAADTLLWHEPYRPAYHYTPAHRWIGDPCGLIKTGGRYLGYSWGAAETEDLVHWKEINDHAITGMPPKTAAFTGSVVVDTVGSAAQGRDTMVAAFTLFEEDSKKQCQAIAFSHDGGKTFSYYDLNPVIDTWSTEFRDPTVIRYQPTGKWVIAVAKALEKKVAFYESDNLKDWTWTSDFGPMGDSMRSWECPDLFQVTVEETGEKKWVLLLSINWAREQYFVGDFDGKRFIPDNPDSDPVYVDDGLDYYASRVFQDYDDPDNDEVVTLGWVNYWDYAPQAPSKWGKGVWSIPRTYSLYTTPDGLRLRQRPVKQLEKLRGKALTIDKTFAAGTYAMDKLSAMANQFEMKVDLSASRCDVAGFNLCVGDGRKVSLSYDVNTGYLTLDRTNCSDVKIKFFDRISNSRIAAPGTRDIRLHIFVDRSTVEVFANDGEKVLTLLTYAATDQTGVEFFTQRGAARLRLTAWPLAGIHDNE
ncbi:MAG: glycoside hydrolase family 32 protein [Muribaculaceae bacterium]|nr:glycoside hydrolase family 32 protein [Muribaculaceae bacterium]